eukprot:CAMPEP_0198126536 /NCGR_PEP_ID=MMETSP1442-20131203/45039_1 /TAXON_ID= /ORGANISM="Craspedostauros australis, Strain CCMP3328" /LENGTH=94 /DNA_ID=CAMNT_0043786335 /DNA_START=188 /DNA_END=472 /DNA_ORIENTATION=-
MWETLIGFLALRWLLRNAAHDDTARLVETVTILGEALAPAELHDVVDASLPSSALQFVEGNFQGVQQIFGQVLLPQSNDLVHLLLSEHVLKDVE